MAEEMGTQNKQRIFGEVAGVAIGSLFPDRASLAKSGIHKPTQAGISGSGNEGADSHL